MPIKNENQVVRTKPEDFRGNEVAARDLLDRIRANDAVIASGIAGELSRGSVLIQQEKVLTGDEYNTWRDA
jgi:hypothetical protein